jgi:peptidyl-prolyl cis-trans isomerase D
MLEVFRSFMKSKVGVGICLGILALIALAFAAADVGGSNKFGGVAGGDRVATIGDRKISTAALSQNAASSLEQYKAENPKLSMKAFVAAGGLTQVLDQMIDRAAISVFGESHGIIAGNRLVDSEIAKIPAFRGPDGKFSEAAYRQIIQQKGLNDATVRGDFADGLIARQVLVPAAFGAKIPNDLVGRYAALFKEKRIGAIALLPSAAFASKGEPSAKELADFYSAHQNNYIRPERRVVRYASFDDTALKSVPAPTEAEIAARYNANKAQYVAIESRRVTQLIVPTEAAASAILAEVAKGGSLETAAQTKGLTAASIGTVTRESLSSQSSQAVADATFATERGKIATPARSGLGWHLMRVDAIDTKPARSLEQARGEIVTALSAEKKRAALTDFSARIEEEFDKGESLADVAKELGITLKETPELTADGQVYGKPGQQAPAELARVVQTAFSMERENEPQLAEVVPGKMFMVFDVTRITTSAPAPLAEIRTDVIVDLKLQQGAAAAKAAAEKVQASVHKGTDLGAAMASLGIPLPPVDRLEMGREDLARRGQAVPPPLALMFSMAEGTVKVLAAPRNRGYYVVALKDIVPGTVAPNDPLLVQARRDLGMVAGREYGEQLRQAIREETGVTRNPSAINAVSRQLVGGN